jgi:hypothetical protein
MKDIRLHTAIENIEIMGMTIDERRRIYDTVIHSPQLEPVESSWAISLFVSKAFKKYFWNKIKKFSFRRSEKPVV